MMVMKEGGRFYTRVKRDFELDLCQDMRNNAWRLEQMKQQMQEALG